MLSTEPSTLGSDLEISGVIHSVESFGTRDGPGIRYVIFFQGCPLRCLYCHNPDSWKISDGKRVTVKEMVDEVLEYYSFIDRGGVTISGGEPLMQPDFAHALLRAFGERGIHTAIDTSGSIPLEKCRDAVAAADLLLLDIKALDNELCKKLTGVGNENTIAILDFREKMKGDVWIRHVIVPGITLDYQALERMADFLSGYSCVKKVELLPFHKMGEYKWKNLGLDYSLEDTRVPTAEEMEKANSYFKKWE